MTIKTVKLLTEDVDFDSVEILTESIDNKKSFKIRCPFMEAEVVNRNGRIYSETLCDRETTKFKRVIDSKLALGEWEHANTPKINRERAAILIEDIQKNGRMYIGTAKVLTSFPFGRLVHSMIDEGIPTGVSSRSTGTVNSFTRRVNEDLNLITYDVVDRPSCQVAMIDNIITEREFIQDGEQYIEVAVDKMKRNLDKHGSKVLVESLKEFLDALKGA